MDEINVFSKVLTLDEIQAAQKAPAGAPVVPIPLTAALEADQIVIQWESSAHFQLQFRVALGQGDWADETTAPTVNGNQKTVRLSTTGPARFFRLISR